MLHAGPAGSQPAAPPIDPVAFEAAAPRGIAVLDCPTGRTLATIPLSGPLAAAPALPPSGRELFAATAADELLRWSLPDGALTARAPLPFPARALAASSGPDAIVLVGGDGAEPLAAFDAVSLAPLRRYPARRAASVATLLDVPARRRLVVGFADLDELWEIAYDREAPPVLAGLVHDYRSNEAVPLPGRLTPRAFVVPGATRALAPGPVPFELARLDAAGALGVVNLDVRREIERPAVSPPRSPGHVAAWREGNARGWLVAGAAPGRDGGAAVAGSAGSAGSSATVLTAPAWRPGAPIALPGEVRALAATALPGRVLALAGSAPASVLVMVDVQTRAAAGLAALPPLDAGARLLVSASGRCVAVIDGGQRWRASHLADGDRLVTETR